MRKPVYTRSNNKGADQTVHPQQISAFVVHYLDRIIPVVAMYNISRL